MSRRFPFYHISGQEERQIGDFNVTTDFARNEEYPHRHDHYMVYLVKEGTTRHLLDFNEYDVEAPALVFIGPGQIHTVPCSQESSITSIAFKAGFALSIDLKDLEHLFQTKVIMLQQDELLQVQPYVDLMQQEYERKANDTVLAGLLTAFLAKCELIFHQYHETTDIEHSNKLVQKFITLIDENFKTLVQVSDYAERMFLTPGHLNDIVKQVTGKSAKSFIDQRRILEAKRLLYWSGNNVKTISWELGFEDPAYFARYFKKHTGELPKNFQLRVKNPPHS